MTTTRNRLRTVPRIPDESGVNYGALPASQVVCRSGHHRFALDDWDPGEEIPRSVTAMHADEGRYKLLEPCLKCWAVTRVTFTHPGGGIDGYLRPVLRYGKEWVKLDADVPRGRRVMRDQKYQRGQGRLKALIGRAVTLTEDAEDAEPSARRPVPRPVFRGVS
jgi:hypothetical protein